MGSGITDLTFAETAARIAARELSPVEVARAHLERIDRINPVINAVVTPTPDLALDQARKAEAEIGRGQLRGPLHGIPFTLKDLFLTRGIRTTAGSRVLERFLPDRNAVVVDRLEAAGAVLLGKVNLDEWAFGGTGSNLPFGETQNPWHPGYSPGGSSGGSAAAVAVSLGLFSLGTDTGGSIRMPAALSGVFGLKPSYALVPCGGVLPESWSLDHAGPLTRTAEDGRLVLGVIGGVPVPSAGMAANTLQGVRVGVPRRHYFESIDIEVDGLVHQALDHLGALGAELVEIELAHLDRVFDCFRIVAWSEAAHYHRRWLMECPERYAPELLALLQAALLIPAADYLQAQRVRTLIRYTFAEAFGKVDVIASASVPFAAVPHGTDTIVAGGATVPLLPHAVRLTPPANLTGEPCCSVPCGFTAAGLPVGLMLHAPLHRDAFVLDVASLYQKTTPWTAMRPTDPRFV